MTILMSFGEACLRLGHARILREGFVPKTTFRLPDLRPTAERLLDACPQASQRLSDDDRYHAWRRLQMVNLTEEFGVATKREVTFMVVDAEQAGPGWHKRPETRSWIELIVKNSAQDGMGQFSCYWTDKGSEPAGIIIAWGNEASVKRHYPNAVLVF